MERGKIVSVLESNDPGEERKRKKSSQLSRGEKGGKREDALLPKEEK